MLAQAVDGRKWWLDDGKWIVQFPDEPLDDLYHSSIVFAQYRDERFQGLMRA